VIDRVALVPQVGQQRFERVDMVPERLALFERRPHHFQREVAELQGWVNGLPACDGGVHLVQNISGVGLGHLFLLSGFLPETPGFYHGRPSMNDGKPSNEHRKQVDKDGRPSVKLLSPLRIEIHCVDQ